MCALSGQIPAGNWGESYPASNYTVTANQYYKINFNSSSKTISLQTVSSCDSVEFTRNFSALNFRGTMNGWATTPMNLAVNNMWSTQIVLDGQTNQRFKFDTTTNWTVNYGNGNGDGILNQNGSDIFTHLVGTFSVQVNDATLAYTLTPVATSATSSRVSSSRSSLMSSAVSSFVSSLFSSSKSSINFSIASSSSASSITGIANGDFRKETIFFLLTARFYDCDASNNVSHGWVYVGLRLGKSISATAQTVRLWLDLASKSGNRFV